MITVQDHFGGGSWPSGKDTDGGFRHYPISFESLCNLQEGFYTVRTAYCMYYCCF